jgi:hypothetical protein
MHNNIHREVNYNWLGGFGGGEGSLDPLGLARFHLD